MRQRTGIKMKRENPEFWRDTETVALVCARARTTRAASPPTYLRVHKCADVALTCVIQDGSTRYEEMATTHEAKSTTPC